MSAFSAILQQHYFRNDSIDIIKNTDELSSFKRDLFEVNINKHIISEGPFKGSYSGTLRFYIKNEENSDVIYPKFYEGIISKNDFAIKDKNEHEILKALLIQELFKYSPWKHIAKQLYSLKQDFVRQHLEENQARVESLLLQLEKLQKITGE